MLKIDDCFSFIKILYYIQIKTTSVVLKEGVNNMGKLKDVNKKIEETVVNSYKKVEDTVVGGYKKVEDKFVEKFLRKDGETIEEAKERVKKEQEELTKKNEEIIKNGGKK
jgi:uncharacterized protein YutE (UPF0331/DUF86 family)